MNKHKRGRAACLVSPCFGKGVWRAFRAQFYFSIIDITDASTLRTALISCPPVSLSTRARQKVAEKLVRFVNQVNIHEKAMLHAPAIALDRRDIGDKVTKWPVAMAYVRYFAFGC